MPVRIFILEDDPNRIISFRERFIEYELDFELVTTEDVEEAKDILGASVFDFVFLDHDLSVEQASGLYRPSEETGADLARWLMENTETLRAHGQYICHSLNYPGRKNIIGALQRGGKNCIDAPFLWEEPVFWKYFSKKF